MKRFFCILAVLCIIASLSVTAFASEPVHEPMLLAVNPSDYEVPKVDTVWDKVNYPYAIIATNSENQIWLTMSTSKFYSYTAISSDGDWKTYKVGSSGNWVYQSQGSGIVNAATTANYILYSTHDVNSKAGNTTVFSATESFFLTLAQKIQAVTGQATTEKIQALGGTVRLLVFCGIGCLALLATLKIFGKRSLIYRN